MVPTIVSSIPELLATIRQRRDELAITNATIDDIGGLSDRHASKLLATTYPSRNLGGVTFPLVLQALGLGIGAVVLIEDAEQVERVRGRWVKRKRPHLKTGKVTVVGKELLTRARPHILRDLSRLGNEARQVLLPGKQRSDIARTAARARWRKQRRRHS